MATRADATERAERLVFLHGFTQTHHHWHACAFRIADQLPRQTVLRFVDLPGHGLADADRADIDDTARRLPLLAGRGTYVGYSMGGRVALSAAATHDPAIERLVLIGATPGIADDAERVRRSEEDERRARRIEEIGVAAFVDEWLAGPLFTSLPPEAAGVAHRRRNTSAGLAHSLRACGAGHQRSLWRELEHVEIPVLVIAGEHDAKFTDIGRRMTAALADAAFASIPGAGHAAHAERTEATARIIADWLIGARP